MKLLKNVAKTLLTSLVLLSPMAFAGNISSGGDNSTAFMCSSPANVDSALRVVGFDYDGSGKIDLKVWIDQTPMAQDQGVYDKSLDQYDGAVFTIILNSQGKKQTGRITAKKANKVLQVGQSDALECRTYLVNGNQ